MYYIINIMYNQSLDNNLNNKKKIKIIAHDRETIHFLSGLLESSITCKLWILYKNNTLKILINRVCWELTPELFEEEKHIKRIHSILTIHNINNIKTNNIFNKKIEFFSLLSISCDYDQKNKTNVLNILLSKGSVKISVSDFYVTIKDISTYWLSNYTPEHSFNL
jgi:hypothetical protein